MTIRPEVQAFAEAMEGKLRRHDMERGDSWKEEESLWLLGRLVEEVKELERILGSQNRLAHEAKWARRVLSEAADVGNFAMMIAEVCRRDLPAPEEP